SHALYPQLDQPHATMSLNGLTQNNELSPSDTTAITWLAAHATPGAVLVEGIDPNLAEYSPFYGRVATFTGIPAVIGWVGHEYQWRAKWIDDPANAADLAARAGDLRTIYTNPNPALVLLLLHHYHVRYVYVGATEQTLYGATADLTSFGKYLTSIYNADGVIIYQVPGV
ncbi:MAG: hypothetical protein H0X24_23070, partial [Ktedonobacterales bacterium]|nr:hypothetical protein [Ktedonobacterales bacterium]